MYFGCPTQYVTRMTVQVPLTVLNQVPHLRTTREFPQESVIELATEMDKAYVDIAGNVNTRVIGIFPVNRPAITGESYYLVGSRRNQSLRQVYTFTSTASIPHGITNFSQIPYFPKSAGKYTDGTNWYGLIDGSNIAIAGQISFYLTPTNIVFLTGAGAPTLISGIVDIEWLSNV